MSWDGTFEEKHENDIQLLSQKLKVAGIETETINQVISSGYFMRKESPDSVYDSFYGTSWLSVGIFSKSQFIELVKKATNDFKFVPNVHQISDTNEIPKILSSNDRDKFYFENGFLSFRGQTEEYTIKRAFPNPTISKSNGEEILILPSVWRKYKNDFNKRLLSGDFRNIFTSAIADELIYYGIKDWKTLGDKNYKKHGVHTISDLEHFPDKESREFYRRWWNFKVTGDSNPQLAVVGQHYGLDTLGLDVTFNHTVASFFASNKYIKKENGKSTYQPVKNGDHCGVIYCFYFRAPTLNRTKDLITDIPTFDHLNPLRPIRQDCALPFFHYYNFNEAYKHVYKIFYLKNDFNTTNLPKADYIFPNKEEDSFYKALLEIKQKNKHFQCFGEYEFD